MLRAPATIANLAPIFGRLKIKGIAAISVIEIARNSVNHNQRGDTFACDLVSKPSGGGNPKTVRTSMATTDPTTPHFAKLGFILGFFADILPPYSTFII